MLGLSLCSGIGGVDLGLARAIPGYRTVCHVEREAYCAAILVARMADQGLDPAPIWDDVRTFDGRPWRGVVDIVTAGFPCQPHSVAGRMRGADDERWIWEDIARIIREVEPRQVFIENVPGLVVSGLERVWTDLRSMGFRVEAGFFSAAEVGAPHRRQRLFILADAEGRSAWGAGGWRAPSDDPLEVADGDSEGRGFERQPDESGEQCASRNEPDRCDADVGDAAGSGLHSRVERGEHDALVRTAGSGDAGDVGHAASARRSAPACDGRHEEYGRCEPFPPGPAFGGRWPEGFEPAVRRVADGDAGRMDRLRALGNAVVPATVELAYRTLAGRIM